MSDALSTALTGIGLPDLPGSTAFLLFCAIAALTLAGNVRMILRAARTLSAMEDGS